MLTHQKVNILKYTMYKQISNFIAPIFVFLFVFCLAFQGYAMSAESYTLSEIAENQTDAMLLVKKKAVERALICILGVERYLEHDETIEDQFSEMIARSIHRVSVSEIRPTYDGRIFLEATFKRNDLIDEMLKEDYVWDILSEWTDKPCVVVDINVDNQVDSTIVAEIPILDVLDESGYKIVTLDSLDDEMIKRSVHVLGDIQIKSTTTPGQIPTGAKSVASRVNFSVTDLETHQSLGKHQFDILLSDFNYKLAVKRMQDNLAEVVSDTLFKDLLIYCDKLHSTSIPVKLEFNAVDYSDSDSLLVRVSNLNSVRRVFRTSMVNSILSFIVELEGSTDYLVAAMENFSVAGVQWQVSEKGDRSIVFVPESGNDK